MLIACAVAVIFQYSTWQYHDASDFSSAIFWLQIRTCVVIVSLPLFYYIYLMWSDRPASRNALIFHLTVCICFLFLHFASDVTLAFAGNMSLVQYTIFTGETIVRVAGDTNPLKYAFQVYALFVLVSLLVIVPSLIKKKLFVKAGIFLGILSLQVVTVVLSSLVYEGAAAWPLLDGLPFTVLNLLVCFGISNSLEESKASVQRHAKRRKNLETVLSNLAAGISSNDSDTFYIQMMEELKNACGAVSAHIGIYTTINGEEYVNTKAVIVGDKIKPNQQFKLSEVPEELHTFNKPIYITKDLSTRFPELSFFSKHNLQAMINMPLNVNEGEKAQGSIILYFDKPLELDAMLKQTVKIFASRAGAEVKRNRLEQELERRAFIDYQTGLPNLTQIHELVEDVYQSHLNDGKQAAYIIVDINRFTEVNRQYGFENAELALKVLGQRLSDYSTKDITIARSGSDKFVVLLHEASQLSPRSDAEGLIDSSDASIPKDVEAYINLQWDAIHRLIAKTITVGQRQINLSCRAGAVVFPLQVKKHVEVARCAETALGQAKKEKGDKLKLFDVDILKEIDRKHQIEILLNRAIDEDKELFAVYQPKVDGRGNLVGAEALARWINKDLGAISPLEFIEVAETTGIIDKFGHWMVNTVCQQINLWRESGFEIPSRIAINFSAYQLLKSDFVLNLINTVNAHNVEPSQIEIELTESGLLTNIEECIAKLNSLRDVGFTVALDDFGTGYSSLSYLKDLPLDVLKIDRSFVNDLENNNSTELARSIIDIGHNMSLAIVAEGVEVVQQVEILNKMGCELYQGYFFAKPMEADKFLNWANDTTIVESQQAFAEQLKP